MYRKWILISIKRRYHHNKLLTVYSNYTYSDLSKVILLCWTFLKIYWAQTVIFTKIHENWYSWKITKPQYRLLHPYSPLKNRRPKFPQEGCSTSPMTPSPNTLKRAATSLNFTPPGVDIASGWPRRGRIWPCNLWVRRKCLSPR